MNAINYECVEDIFCHLICEIVYLKRWMDVRKISEYMWIGAFVTIRQRESLCKPELTRNLILGYFFSFTDLVNFTTVRRIHILISFSDWTRIALLCTRPCWPLTWASEGMLTNTQSFWLFGWNYTFLTSLGPNFSQRSPHGTFQVEGAYYLGGPQGRAV